MQVFNPSYYKSAPRRVNPDTGGCGPWSGGPGTWKRRGGRGSGCATNGEYGISNTECRIANADRPCSSIPTVIPSHFPIPYFLFVLIRDSCVSGNFGVAADEEQDSPERCLCDLALAGPSRFRTVLESPDTLGWRHADATASWRRKKATAPCRSLAWAARRSATAATPSAVAVFCCVT